MKSDLEPFAMVPRDLIGNVSPRALEVWAIMAAWYVRDEKVFRPPVNRIARALGTGRRSVERALAELVQHGRLARTSGKKAGRANEYELRFSRREFWPEKGTSNPPQGYGKNDVPTNKVVKTYLNHTPVVPVGDGREDDDSGWRDFWRLYPRKDKAERARSAWRRLSPDDRAAALQAVALLAEVYAAAHDRRKPYTMQAHRWLTEKCWTDSPEAMEAHYHVPGLAAERRREQQRQEANARRLAEFRQDMNRKSGA